LNADPFYIDSMMNAVFIFLLNDQPAEAVRLLGAVRSRGTSAAIEKANAMLKELAVVYPDAARVQQARVPDPPDIHELLTDVQFNAPDLQLGRNFVAASPIEMGGWFRKLENAYPPPAEPAPVVNEPAPAPDSTSQSATLTTKVFHVQVVPVGDTRDLVIRKIGAGQAGLNQSAPSGFLLVSGVTGQIPVVVNGQFVSQQLPAHLVLPSGKYEVQTIEEGKVLSKTEVEIPNSGMAKVEVTR
jgi:hypothetical protein